MENLDGQLAACNGVAGQNGPILRGKANRGQLIMACGTGKTLTALWIAERLQSALTLVVVPSLSLVAQNLAEWGRHAATDFDTIVVCSDESVVQSKADTAIQSTADLGVRVTTNDAEIRRSLYPRSSHSEWYIDRGKANSVWKSNFL
ncbi:MAG: hypothetical protein FJ295_21235 [Planctomycetes bacterium]|nr:hypothetical protein [Planctomycetota bacterium]